MAKASGVTFDDLYRRAPARSRLAKQEGDSRLCRRLLAIEKLEHYDKREVPQLLDAFIERGQLQRAVENRA